MGPNAPSPGQLLSLDVIDGRDAVPAAKKLLKSRGGDSGISTWDASSIFFEMQTRDLDRHRLPVVRVAGCITFGGHDLKRAIG